MKEQVESFYLHVPFCRHLCNYCDFYKKRTDGSHQAFREYESNLLQQWEILHQSNFLKKVDILPFRTLYLGGGTPSLWKNGALFLRDFFLKNDLSFSKCYQATLEVDPGSWTSESIDKWIDFGINRFSIGIQTLDELNFTIADRGYQFEENIKTLEYFSKKGVDFSVDFLLSLPQGDRKRDIIKELKQVLEFEPSHLSLYILTVGKEYKHYSNLPNDERIRDEYLKVSKFLTSHGFDHYEVSNFAKSKKRSEHNNVYWEGKNYISLGDSATGQCKFDNQMIRYKWVPTKNRMSIEEISSKELELELRYTSLRSSGLALSRLNSNHLKVINEWTKLGYGNISQDYFRMNASGWIVLDSVVQSIL